MSIISRIMSALSSKRRHQKQLLLTTRAELRMARRMNRQRGKDGGVVNPAGTKLARKAAEGTLTLKWGR